MMAMIGHSLLTLSELILALIVFLNMSVLYQGNNRQVGFKTPHNRFSLVLQIPAYLQNPAFW
jgi:hypothetical protein